MLASHRSIHCEPCGTTTENNLPRQNCLRTYIHQRFCPPNRALRRQPRLRLSPIQSSQFPVPACRPVSTNACLYFRAHCPPAPVCAPMACPVPTAKCPICLQWYMAGRSARNEKCQFSAPTHDSPFLRLKPSLWHRTTTLKIWETIALPVPAL